MNREDIIRMAREANLLFPGVDQVDGSVEQLERFAALVAAAERDKWMERTAILIRGEREACAIAAWSTGMDLHMKKHDAREIGSACAAAIRARGDADAQAE